MFSPLRQLISDVRRSPFYAGLLGLGLVVFVTLGLRGSRLLGDDNESNDTELAGPPRTGGHGGYVHGFHHK